MTYAEQLKSFKWKEKDVQSLLLDYLSKRPEFNLLTTNYLQIMPFEADVLLYTNLGYLFEYEIKTNKTDLLKDYKKINSRGINKHQYLIGNDDILEGKYRPNKFYFVAPHGVFNGLDIDIRYGLIEVLESGQVYCKRKAKFLHRNKKFNNDDILSMCRNFALKQCVNKETKWSIK